MKILGLLLLIVGTMIAGAFGAQNIDSVTERSTAKVRAGTLLQQAEKAHTVYCRVDVPASPEATALKVADGCTPAEAGVSYDALLAQTLEGFAERDAPAELAGASPEVVAAREAWLAARRAAAPAIARFESVRVTTLPHEDDAAVIGDLDAYDEAEAAAHEGHQAITAALGAYCDVALASDAPAALRSADGCPTRRKSARLQRLQTIAERVLPKAEFDQAPKSSLALESLLSEKLGGEDQLEAELAGMRKTERAAAYEAAVTGGREDLATKRAATVPPPLKEARDAWLTALAATIEPTAIAATLPDPPLATERLTGWLEGPGVMFFVGLALIILGVILARVALKREARRDAAAADAAQASGASTGPRVVDFGKLLGELADEVAALAADMAATTDPDGDDLERVKTGIEALQLHKAEPLAEARGRLVVRYGMNGFADVMSPFSAGERYLNRAWSTLVDRYWDECADAMGKAAAYFAETKRVLDGLIEGKRQEERAA